MNVYVSTPVGRRRRRTACALLAVLAAASGAQARPRGAQTSAAAWRTFLSLDDPGFAHHPAPVYRGPARKLVFTRANARYRKYRTSIAEDATEGVNFAGDHVLVAIGCGTGCASAFDVGLRSGAVNILPTGWFTNDFDFMHRPDSRYLKLLHRETRGREERCLGQAYVWTGTRLAPTGPELTRPVDGFVCDGFERR